MSFVAQRIFWISISFAILLFPALVLAVDLGRINVHAQYEEELIRWGLAQTRLQRDPHPTGKIIEKIVIARENIIAQSDIWPNFLNYIHIKTKEHVIRQEMLISVGEPWDEKLIEESERNLRQLFILATIRTVACQSSTPGHVILLVITKDLWSLRLNTLFEGVGSVVNYFDFFPSEENFLGLNKRVGLHLQLNQLDLKNWLIYDHIKLGQTYIDRRIWGSRLRLEEAFDVIMAGNIPCAGKGENESAWCSSHRPGSFEGLSTSITLTRPLFSLATKWGFAVKGAVDHFQYRRYATTSSQQKDNANTVAIKTAHYESSNHESFDVPRVYDAKQISTSASLTRSYGLSVKHNVSVGIGAYQNAYTLPDNFPFPLAIIEQYRKDFLPYNEEAAYLAVEYQTYSPRYVRLHNIQRFALSEDFLLGHIVLFDLKPAVNLQDSAQSFVSMLFQAQYRSYFHDDLFTIWLNGSTRFQPGLSHLGRPAYCTNNDNVSSSQELAICNSPSLSAWINPNPWINSKIEIGIKNVFPQLWAGRFHFQVRSIIRGENLFHETSQLGGDSGLRGYPSDQFEGRNLFRVNTEYRSNPINILSVHLGYVLFYDGGAVFGGNDPTQPDKELVFNYHQSLGIGIRGQLPQLDKEAFRMDLGFPLSRDAIGTFSNWISFSFSQVF
jgi:hypothetical protein